MKKVSTMMVIAVVLVFGLMAQAEQITLTVSNPWATITDGNTVAFKRLSSCLERLIRTLRWKLTRLPQTISPN